MEISELHREYKSIIEEDLQKYRKTALEADNYIKNCSLKFRNNITLKTLAIPSIFTKREFSFFEEELKTLYGIFDKIDKAYRSSSEIRKMFGFSKNTEELILLEKPYKSTIPIARIDLFYNPETGDYKFCEFNTDGSSAMNEDRELNNALRMTEAFKVFSEKYNITTGELFDSWVDCFRRLYNDYSKGKPLKTLAIADFLDRGTVSEFEVFAKHFEDAGIQAEICDIRDFKYEEGRLISPRGTEIDAIYRRAVTLDIDKEYNNVQPLINAVKDNSVCLVGDFRTQLPHNKIIFKVLWQKEAQHLFDDKEREFIKKHIPYTTVLTADAVQKNNAAEQKDRWIIKPQDSYASKGFYAGENCTLDQWKKLLEENTDNDYILQEFCMPYKSENIDLTAENPQFRQYSTLPGMFVYDGKLCGLYTRAAKGDIITTQYDELTLPTIIVDEK